MGVINRCLLFLYTLFFGLLCLGMVLLCLHLVPERVLINEYTYVMDQWQTGAAAGLLFLISVHLLFCSFASGKAKTVNAKELLVIQGATGQVNISLSAIREMAERMAISVHGVREAKVKTVVERRKEEGDFLKLDVRIVVGPERNIAAVSDDIRSRVGKYISESVGINGFELAVSVQSIASGVNVKKRRVN